jgi:hypothetical protein
VREIPLTKGYVAIVDDEDYERLSALKWYAQALNGARTVYAYTRTGRASGHVTIGMHRMVMGPPPWLRVDHINFNGLDNRRCNLRVGDVAQNGAHAPKRRGSSRFKGVSWSKRSGRWYACIASGVPRRSNPKMSKTLALGLFDSEEDAARAYNLAAQKRFGEFAFLNEVPE